MSLTRFPRRLLLAAALLTPSAFAVPVGLELALLVDVSGSVDNTEYALQKTGYVTAFQSAAIQALIASVPNGIAVTYIEWSGASQQSQLVNWTLLTNASTANAFAAAIAGTSRAFGGQTAPGSAINFALPRFTGNGFEGTRSVMDVSGDGAANEGASTSAAAAAALAAGVRVNGLVILGESGLQAFYQTSIATPGGGFLLVANDFADFADAVNRKLAGEIINVDPTVPEPSTTVLFTTGLTAALWLRKRSKRGQI